jgi:hypothetical protein
VSETVWNWGYDVNAEAAVGSGGGINFNGIAIPGWQAGVNMTTNQGSSTLRNIPDVAMVGDNIEVYYDEGQTEDVGGTSCAAPLWAGFTALINQQATALNKPTVGYMNPAIYAIGLGPNYPADFHDIITGNNTNLTVTANYYAVPGYDLCTGWGTPMGQSLINAFVLEDSLVISPLNGFAATGPAGGPFSPDSQTYSLVNSGTNSLTWSFINNSTWLGASATGGTLAPGATNSLTVSLTSGANNLAVGSYAASVGSSNWNTHVVQDIPFTLRALQPLAVTPTAGFGSSGPAGGPFSPPSQNFVLTNSSSSPLAWSLINTSSWLSASATSGTVAAGSASNVVVSVNGAALGVGTYSATLWFTNQSNGGSQAETVNLQVLQPLQVSPTNGFVSSISVGGQYNVTSQNYSVTNIGSTSLNWALVNTSAWLTVSGGGALGAGATTTATVSLNSVATNLGTGIYTATVWFTNQTSGGGTSMQFELLVNQSLIINGGFETGNFNGWTLNLITESNGFLYNFVTNKFTERINLRRVTVTPQSGSYFAALGTGGGEGYLSQNVATVAGIPYLLSLWMENADGETPNEFTVWWNGGTLFDQIDMPKSGWTNLQYIVTATGNSAVVQIGARDDATYLELDNVSLTPISPPAFTPITTANNKSTFSWNATTGLVYQVESTTNLLQPSWITNAIIKATSTTINFTDTNSVANFPEKFYRLELLP